MKSIHELSNELIEHMPLTTSYDHTKILVFVSYIIDKPYRYHRLELKFYSIRYKAHDNIIYVYNKYFEMAEEVETDCMDEVDITDEYSAKIYIRKSIKDAESELNYRISRLFNRIKQKIIDWIFRFRSSYNK